MRIRESRADEDALLASHFRQMWLDNGIPAERIREDWEARVGAFVAAARRELAYRGFVAEWPDAGVVGSVVCQLFAGLYPNILVPDQRKYGYVWGVYVDVAYRRRGIAKALTRTSLAYLTSIGCTHALLHASPPGRPVYDGLGFEGTNEMRLALR